MQTALQAVNTGASRGAGLCKTAQIFVRQRSEYCHREEMKEKRGGEGRWAGEGEVGGEFVEHL